MRAIIIALIASLSLYGCMGTENYYKAQTAYYTAQTQAQIAYIEAQKDKQPLAQMVAPDGTCFTVNQVSNLPAPVINVPQNPVIAGLKTVITSTPMSILAGSWGARELIKAATGDMSVDNGSSLTTTRDSNNQTELNNADEGIDRKINNSVNDTDNRSNYENSVSDPTIVEQPPAVIVEQPEPVIINREPIE